MRTMQLIESAVSGKGSLDEARTVAVSRGWSPELFARKVQELSHGAKVAKPSQAQVKAAKAPATPKVGVIRAAVVGGWSAQRTITYADESTVHLTVVHVGNLVGPRATGAVIRIGIREARLSQVGFGKLMAGQGKVAAYDLKSQEFIGLLSA